MNDYEDARYTAAIKSTCIILGLIFILAGPLVAWGRTGLGISLTFVGLLLYILGIGKSDSEGDK